MVFTIAGIHVASAVDKELEQFHLTRSRDGMHGGAKERMDAVRISPCVEKPLGRPAVGVSTVICVIVGETIQGALP